MPFVSSTLKSFEKWRSPLFGATGKKSITSKFGRFWPPWFLKRPKCAKITDDGCLRASELKIKIIKLTVTTYLKYC
jgi:hypothetical protein